MSLILGQSLHIKPNLEAQLENLKSFFINRKILQIIDL